MKCAKCRFTKTVLNPEVVDGTVKRVDSRKRLLTLVVADEAVRNVNLRKKSKIPEVVMEFCEM
jgi:hypothetical protein